MAATMTNESWTPPPVSGSEQHAADHGAEPHRKCRTAGTPGSRQMRPASVPTAPPARNGQAISATPSGSRPSAWLSRPIGGEDAGHAAPSATLAEPDPHGGQITLRPMSTSAEPTPPGTTPEAEVGRAAGTPG